MNGLPVCPYCDAEVPSHILKAHMALCSDSQRSTPVRLGYLGHSPARMGLGYYTTLMRNLPAYKPSDALEDAALDALLSPKTDTSQLLQSLVGSQGSAMRRVRASVPQPPLPPPSPTSVSTALFPAAGPRDAAHLRTTDSGATAVRPSTEASKRRSGSALQQSRESTLRPSPFTGGEAAEEIERCGAGQPGFAVAGPPRCVSHAATPITSSGQLSKDERDRLTFLELTCEELRQSMSFLQRENRLQKERHDVLEETLYGVLQQQQHNQLESRPMTITAAPHAAPTTRWPQNTTPPPAELDYSVASQRQQPFEVSAVAAQANHYSDIDLLGTDMSIATTSWDRMVPRLSPFGGPGYDSSRAWPDVPSNFY